METYKRMNQLLEQLNKAAIAYYSTGDSIMSDLEYDELYSELEDLEKQAGFALANSLTTTVGYKPISDLKKTRHEYPSLSLKSTKDPKEISAWLGDKVALLTRKYDGLTVILTYDCSCLSLAETRGDGYIGEDVTHNASLFSGVPSYIPDKRHIVIRGEAVISYNEFEHANNQLDGSKQYKNPRNMVSGLTRVLDSKKMMDYKIQFMPFELVNAKELGLESRYASYMFIQSLGFEPIEYTFVCGPNVANVIESWSNIINDEYYQKKISVPTDGLVVAIDDLDDCDRMGKTAKYPKSAMAFKWADERKMTVLNRIIWSVSPKGLLSPIAEFDPIDIDGTTVKRASLHNIQKIRDLRLGIGDRISVYKSNQIIPQIYSNMDQTDNVSLPNVCPVCGEDLKKMIGKNKTTEFLYCMNDECLSRTTK